MKNTVYFVAFIVVVAVCGQACSNNSVPAGTQAPTSDGNDPVMTSLDSIDKANSESVIASGDNVTKAYISSSDSSIYLTANIRQDHRIFGFEKPNNQSKRLLLLSVFTNDVENNPFQCELGAFYDTNSMGNLRLKFVASEGDFIKAAAIDDAGQMTTIYFEKQWIEFE
jgi:hypothetical protein